MASSGGHVPLRPPLGSGTGLASAPLFLHMQKNGFLITRLILKALYCID